jgi:hypothetical protein
LEKDSVTENTLQWIQVAKFLAIGVFAGLYGFGGVSGKWKRRIIAPVTFIAGIIGFSLWTGSFTWSLLFSVWLLFITLTIGYGSYTTKGKVIKRSRAGFANAVASLSIFWATGAWSLLFLHIGVCVATSVIAGVWNATPDARSEETLIGASIVTIPYFTI